jgi:DNA-binding CsgD family transcriptional regulator
VETALFLRKTLNRAVIVLRYRKNWRPVFFTALAKSYTRKYFASSISPIVPPEIVHFLERQSRQVQIPAASGEALVIVAVHHADHPNLVMLLLEEVWNSQTGSCRLLQQQLGVTEREAEVLYWIARGKTSCEIAIILGTASTTVKKHVQNILGKLGVENRLTAGLRAANILGLIQ